MLKPPVSRQLSRSVTSATAGSATAISQTYTGVVKTTSARYAPLSDLGSLDSSSVSEICQNFRGLVMSPIGSRFRPGFGVTRAGFATAMVMGGRVPQYLPAQSSYSDIRDRATMLFVESAQAAPNAALFPGLNPGGNFQP